MSAEDFLLKRSSVCLVGDLIIFTHLQVIRSLSLKVNFITELIPTQVQQLFFLTLKICGEILFVSAQCNKNCMRSYTLLLSVCVMSVCKSMCSSFVSFLNRGL